MSTLTHSPDQDGLFELVDLLPPLVLPNNLLAMQEAALQRGGADAVLALHREWSTERRERSWADVRRDGPTYYWSPTICGPKVDPESTATCQPHIVSVDLRCDHRERCECVGDLLYRHLCTCGHVDAPHASENAAAEDAMDHAWAGWRDLPIMACSMPDERKQQARWLTDAVEAYPTGWLEAGGPVLTARSRNGRRHVPGRTPFHGYDMGIAVGENYLSHLYKPGLYEPNLLDTLTAGDEER